MRITCKIIAFLALASVASSSVSAASPFDIILGRAPDITVTDIHQETRFVYMRVCNLGGSITDSSTSLALAMKKTGGGVISSVESVLLDTNECHEFQIASVDDLGITTSGTYDISAGAMLKDGRAESVKDNNKITRSVVITYPSKYSATQYGYNNNNYNYSTGNSYYCNSSNNYCGSNNLSNNNTYYCSYNNTYSSTNNCSNGTYGGSTTYYCIPGTSNCSTTPYSNYYNNDSNYCNSSNNYCNNNSTTYYNGSYTYYRSNICPTGDYACNNSYYNSTNTPYQYNNTYCTYSNNYCNAYNNGNYNNGNYNNGYNYYNGTQYDLPDLVVQKVYQNSSDKHIIAQICNQGGDMRNSASIRTDFSSNGRLGAMYNTLQMGRWQCTSSVVYTTPEEMNLYYNGNASISVTVDANNNVSEQNESNNTSSSQYIYVETNRNQKADLVVDRVYANDSNRTITAHVCNTGDDMLDNSGWMIEIVNTTSNNSTRSSGSRLGKGQCMDVNANYSNLGVYLTGNYNFRVTVDSENNISEQMEWNNVLNQNIYVTGNY